MFNYNVFERGRKAVWENLVDTLNDLPEYEQLYDSLHVEHKCEKRYGRNRLAHSLCINVYHVPKPVSINVRYGGNLIIVSRASTFPTPIVYKKFDEHTEVDSVVEYIQSLLQDIILENNNV